MVESSGGFELLENKLSMEPVDHGQTDGVRLDEEEKKYLLPHFCMMLIGKPGSGKTTLLKQLMTNKLMYYRKFDEVLLISPSHAKMDLKIKHSNVQEQFSLDWIFKKVDEITEKQLEDVFGNKLDSDYKEPNKRKPRTLVGHALLGDAKSRFMISDMYKTTPGSINAAAAIGKGDKKDKSLTDKEKYRIDRNDFIQKKYKELKRMPEEEVDKKRKNVLLVLDDVVGPIKKAEYDPRLAQLFMNRRHLIFNGTLSIIVVSQKYTLIPTRIRSTANWLIFYQLNPKDFENVYKDVVVLHQKVWKELVGFVFGATAVMESIQQNHQQNTHREEEEEEKVVQAQPDENKEKLKMKTFDNMGIWIESNTYFKNFKKINL